MALVARGHTPICVSLTLHVPVALQTLLAALGW